MKIFFLNLLLLYFIKTIIKLLLPQLEDKYLLLNDMIQTINSFASL